MGKYINELKSIRISCELKILLLFGAVFISMFFVSVAIAKEPDPFLHISNLCKSQTELVEQHTRIPAQLLRAIAMSESGRWHGASNATVPWPWTVTANGKGKYFSTKKEAVGYARYLQNTGVKNIDVGCMQVNLMYHGDQFDSIEQAMDPRHNVGYAAKFLSKLKKEAHSWTLAVARYHSHNKKFSGPYRRRVFKNWNVARKLAYLERRAKYLARYQARKAKRELASAN